MIIKVNEPFERTNSDFIQELRHPERLSADVKFYALLGTFSAAYAALTANDVPFGKETHFEDVLRAGVHLGTKFGLKQPKDDLLFYLKFSDVDKKAAQWGVHLYKAMMDDPIARQSWETDRSVIVLQAKTDVEFCGNYDHRVQHGNEETACTFEHEAAKFHSHRASFDIKLHEIVREHLWNSFWGRGEEIADLPGQVSLFWKDALAKNDSEYQELLFLEKRLVAELEKDVLAVQLLAMYKESGGLPRRIFI